METIDWVFSQMSLGAAHPRKQEASKQIFERPMLWWPEEADWRPERQRLRRLRRVCSRSEGLVCWICKRAGLEEYGTAGSRSGSKALRWRHQRTLWWPCQWKSWSTGCSWSTAWCGRSVSNAIIWQEPTYRGTCSGANPAFCFRIPSKIKCLNETKKY